MTRIHSPLVLSLILFGISACATSRDTEPSANGSDVSRTDADTRDDENVPGDGTSPGAIPSDSTPNGEGPTSAPTEDVNPTPSSSEPTSEVDNPSDPTAPTTSERVEPGVERDGGAGAVAPDPPCPPSLEDIRGGSNQASNENGQTGSVIPPIQDPSGQLPLLPPCIPPDVVACSEDAECEPGLLCDRHRDWQDQCAVTFRDKACFSPCVPGECGPPYECQPNGRCELVSCEAAAWTCQVAYSSITLCDPAMVDLDADVAPFTAAGCRRASCREREEERGGCPLGQVCDPEDADELVWGCRRLPCDHPDGTCPFHHGCDPASDRADEWGCVPLRCDLGEQDCAEINSNLICQPECSNANRHGCVRIPEGSSDACGVPPEPSVTPTPCANP